MNPVMVKDMTTREKELVKETKAITRADLDKVDIIEALKSALSYNGLDEVIKDWNSEKHITKWKCGQSIMQRVEDIGSDLEMDSALQLVYMICVILFGDYGTSPRHGWIEDVEGFHKFID